ncbi:hypothetical protein E4T56_gene12310 [Termitomyces sp. T112]|nr:hypothetical protein E4T56_gene12310 [Termitomyces sp. T112]KAH0583994.1 hypothetical protein H2248_009575 [Termitomyces sp. 'cryptogamus']
MQYSPIFIKTRVIALSSISLLDFLWAVISCIVLFSQWTALDASERSLILVMLITHSVTVVVLLLLLILHFRPWLDAARMMFLLTIQFGMAGVFVHYYPSFQCLNQVTRQEGICTFIIALILVGSWITPILFVIYVFGLALMIWRNRAMTSESVDQESVLEPQKAEADPVQDISLHATLAQRASDSNHDSESLENNRYSYSMKFGLVESYDRVPIIAARLSKPPPVFLF